MDASTWTFLVRGIPAPKGSVTAFKTGDGRPFVTTQKTKGLKEWQTAVGFVMQSEWQGEPLRGAVAVALSFRMLRPKSARKSDYYMAKRPDIDKLVRAVLDGMTGIVFIDDGQVAQLTAIKHYESGTGPGVYIEVSSL
ncbi:hypothetical protein LCGC14_0745480 [marine sediment metagenome]|uniref:Uncharacterized protein n=1 Tax=marine sediment metagenome TaxID=412755 RepID=A0A0F9Q5N4_9ZZZZ